MRALLVMLLLLAVPAQAAETLLRLSETAHVAARPDELVAMLRADGSAATAAAAQGRVNVAIARALDEAKAVPGVVAATGVYNVWQRPPPNLQWQAQQTVQLKGSDGAAMLALVGSLQASGLAVDRLGWQVSAAAGRKVQSEATKLALAALRGRAEEAAAILGLKFVGFREIRLDSQRPVIMAMPAPRALMAAQDVAAPRAEATEVDITATVEADAMLSP